MDGRRPTGILYVQTDVDAPHKQAEYHRWYLDVHFPDVVEPGVFASAAMFHNAREPVPAGEGRFLAFYETHWDDLAAASAAFKRWVDVLVAERRIHPGTVSRRIAILRSLGVAFATQRRRRSQSVVALELDAGPGGESALREWGLGRGVPDALAHGLFHTGSLHERIDEDAFADVAAPDQARFLALFESDFGDPAALAAALARLPAAAPLPGAASLRRVSCFHRASP
jgi:hypothetical protein